MTYCALDLVENYLRRYVAYPSEHASAAHALWIAHCHLIDEFDITPRLAFMSVEMRSGKTRALEASAPLLPNAKLFFSPSPAAMVRLINSGNYVVMTDEIDGVYGRDKAAEGAADLRTMMNSGYKKGATCPRCKPNTLEVEELNAFGPLAIAGIGTLPATVGDRSIVIEMKRRAPDEHVEDFEYRFAEDAARPVREALCQWCEGAILPERPDMPVSDRAAEIWRPLIRIADAAGDDRPARARAAAVFFTEENVGRETATDGIALLEHIRDAFLEADKIWTSTLLERLRERPESPWKDIRGKPLDDRGLAKRLKPYGIKSRDVWDSGTTRKGYCRADFDENWKRYLPASWNKGDEGDEGEEIDIAEQKPSPHRPPSAQTMEKDDFEERAAVLEFDGGLSREDAETTARDELYAELDDIPPHLDRRPGRRVA
jgi:hypothetical protein